MIDRSRISGKIITIILAVVLLANILLVTSCSSGQGATSTRSSSTTDTGTTATTASSGNAAAQLADAGKTVFADNCARCHGDQGQGIIGPALIGQYASIDKYITAQGLLDFIDTTMPLGAAGSLSGQQYLQIVTFLLLQNNYVTPSTVIDPNNLKSISLK